MALDTHTTFAGIAAPNATLRHGHVYAIVVEGAGPLDRLVHATLIAAARREARIGLVAAREQLDAVLRSGPADDVRHALEGGQLTILETAAADGAMPEVLVGRLARELRHFDLRGDALVMLDHAEALFNGDNRANLAMARQLRNWAEEDNHAVVLLLRTDAKDANGVLRRMREAAPLFGGIARLRLDGRRAMWDTLHWHHAHGTVSGLTQRLQVNPQGGLALSRPDTPDTGVAGMDDQRVLAVRSVLQESESSVMSWEMSDTLTELQAAADGHGAATILLGFCAGIGFDALARTVLALRAAGGRHLKIVVREVDMRMRHNQEALLLQVGANLVVPYGVGMSRFLSMCVAVQGQVFLRPVPASYEEAASTTQPEAQQGYLAPATFVTAVQASMQRGQASLIESGMVRLKLVNGLSPLDALRYCKTRRAGDVLTADASAVYVFLYACRESDIAATLDRLFSLPVSELFGSESRYVTARDIGAACATLSLGASAGARDLTQELAEATTPGQAPAQVAPAASTNNGPAPLRHVAPAAAVRRALPRIGQQADTVFTTA